MLITYSNWKRFTTEISSEENIPQITVQIKLKKSKQIDYNIFNFWYEFAICGIISFVIF